MPYRAEVFKPGFIYHVYNRGNRKQQLFFADSEYDRFIRRMAEETEGDFRLHAYTLIPNHFHLLLEQLTTRPISDFLGIVQLAYAKYFSLKYKPVGGVFGSRFKAKRIDSDEYLLEVVRYIHQNAPKAGLCKTSADWRWSSYLSYVGDMISESFVTTEKVLECFHSKYPGADFADFNLKIDESPDEHGIFIDAPKVIQTRD